MKNSETYNKGVESGLKIAQKIIEKETTTLDYLRNQIDKICDIQSDMRNAVEAIILCQNEESISKYYGLCNQKSPRDLLDFEKAILMNIIATLASASEFRNCEQEKFLINLRHYIGVNTYELDNKYSYDNIDKLKNIDSLFIIAKVIREYLFLEENNFDIYDDYEELFNMFRLNDKDYTLIDGMISITFTIFGAIGIVENYGYCGEEKIEEEIKPPYLNIKKNDKIQISKECAIIYFDNRFKRKKNRYIESSSYVIYEEDNKLVAYHKKTSEKKVILEKGYDISEIFDLKNITTYSDMMFYVIGRDVYFYELNDDTRGLFVSLKKSYNADHNLFPIRNIGLSENKFICGNGKLCIVDLENKHVDNVKIPAYGYLNTYDKYIVIDDYLYFIVEKFSKGGKQHNFSYNIFKYGMKNKHVTKFTGTDILKIDGFKYSIAIEYIGSYEKNIVLIMKKNHIGEELIGDVGKFYCVTVDTSNELAKEKVIKIEGEEKKVGNNFVAQLNINENNIVFVDHKYDMYALDILSEKKTKINEKCGKNNNKNKISLGTKLSLGVKTYIDSYNLYKYENKEPAELILMGNWVYCEQGKKKEIFSIKDNNE
ncbi:MAG: hypothetical protein IJA34_08555 [Lachnospiraceae bacterium]|nr:hypothetical protein [Lachnospiraceae bacterium]